MRKAKRNIFTEEMDIQQRQIPFIRHLISEQQIGQTTQRTKSATTKSFWGSQGPKEKKEPSRAQIEFAKRAFGYEEPKRPIDYVQTKYLEPARPKTRKADPGPGHYSVRKINSSLAGIMSKTGRPEIKNTNPGPGEYETAMRTDFKNVKITPHERFHNQESEYMVRPPGPADYRPSSNYLSTQKVDIKNISIMKSQRYYSKKDENKDEDIDDYREPLFQAPEETNYAVKTSYRFDYELL